MLWGEEENSVDEVGKQVISTYEDNFYHPNIVCVCVRERERESGMESESHDSAYYCTHLFPVLHHNASRGLVSGVVG